MSAQLIEFPNPAAPDAEEVRSLLAHLRRTGTEIPSDFCIGSIRVWRECQRRGLREPNTRTIIDELRREEEAKKWLAAEVIEFPAELAEIPLQSLPAIWRYSTARADYFRALKAGEPTPPPVSRSMANAYGKQRRKPGKRQAAQMLAEIDEAEESIRASLCVARDESLETFITIRQMGDGGISHGLSLIGKAVRGRKHHPSKFRCTLGEDSPPGAA